MEGNFLSFFTISGDLGLEFRYRVGLNLSIPTLIMVWISIVNLIFIFIEDLKLYKIHTLLDEINVSKVLQVENEFSYCP